MLAIPCPWCGSRDETEFRYGGQAGLVTPPDPEAVDDARWAEFLYVRDNPKGPFRERWYHRAGCRRWFVVERDTLTYVIADVRPAGAVPPDGDA
jgi:sarcosine oxidase subunit delta